MRHHGRRITRIHHRSGMCRPSRKGLLPMIEIRDPRLTTRMRTPAAAAAMLSVCVAATACSMEETALRQITPNAVVYIDGWDQDGDRGDRALVERLEEHTSELQSLAYVVCRLLLEKINIKS